MAASGGEGGGGGVRDGGEAWHSKVQTLCLVV